MTIPRQKEQIVTTLQKISAVPNSRTEKAIRGVYDTLNADILDAKFVNPSGGQDYFVDGNVVSSGDGLSWDAAYKTLTEAITASNISIALTANRWWARRNRIFVVADSLTETLVAYPTKTDIIGLGSFNGNTQPGLTGHHVPAVESYGTRWFNMHFTAVAAAAPIHTLAGASSVSGCKFYDCTFDATIGTVTSAILATASPGLEVINCEMIGAFATSYITFGTGEAGRANIEGNRMSGSLGTGVALGAGTTSSWGMWMKNNDIQCVGLWVDDDADILHIINNRALTDVDCATYTAGFDASLGLMSGNLQTGSNAFDHDSVPHILFA